MERLKNTFMMLLVMNDGASNCEYLIQAGTRERLLG